MINEAKIREIVREELAKLLSTHIHPAKSTAPDCLFCGSNETNWMTRTRKNGSKYTVVRCRSCGKTQNLNLERRSLC